MRDGELQWQSEDAQTKTESGRVYNTTVTGLEANTDYTFRLRVLYTPGEAPYFWPPGPMFTFKTDGKSFL